jgi:hypothetical protein
LRETSDEEIERRVTERDEEEEREEEERLREAARNIGVRQNRYLLKAISAIRANRQDSKDL